MNHPFLWSYSKVGGNAAAVPYSKAGGNVAFLFYLIGGAGIRAAVCSQVGASVFAGDCNQVGDNGSRLKQYLRLVFNRLSHYHGRDLLLVQVLPKTGCMNHPFLWLFSRPVVMAL